MTQSSADALWMALAVGALEPGDAAALLRSAGPLGPLRLATVQLLAGLSGAVHHHAPVATLGTAPLLGTDTSVRSVHLGGRIRLRVLPPGPAAGVRPLLLRQTAVGTDRLLPGPDGAWPTLEAFLPDDGQRLIDLVVGEPAGEQTLVLALLSAAEVTDPWPVGDPRDARAADAVQSGQLPGAVLRLRVS